MLPLDIKFSFLLDPFMRHGNYSTSMEGFIRHYKHLWGKLFSLRRQPSFLLTRSWNTHFLTKDICSTQCFTLRRGCWNHSHVFLSWYFIMSNAWESEFEMSWVRSRTFRSPGLASCKSRFDIWYRSDARSTHMCHLYHVLICCVRRSVAWPMATSCLGILGWAPQKWRQRS